MLSFLTQLAIALPLLVSATPLEPRQNIRQYIITNNCPVTTDLFIAGQYDSTIASKGSVTKFLSESAGFFYSDANGGAGNAVGSTRAGFAGDYYYMVTDPNHFNMAMNVRPRVTTPPAGFCGSATCAQPGCAEAFPQPPTRFPPPATTPPNLPYFRCPVGNTTYDITFCPDGAFP